jgi:hypothetical protein
MKHHVVIFSLLQTAIRARTVKDAETNAKPQGEFHELAIAEQTLHVHELGQSGQRIAARAVARARCRCAKDDEWLREKIVR